MKEGEVQPGLASKASDKKERKTAKLQKKKRKSKAHSTGKAERRSGNGAGGGGDDGDGVGGGTLLAVVCKTLCAVSSKRAASVGS